MTRAEKYNEALGQLDQTLELLRMQFTGESPYVRGAFENRMDL